MTTLETLIDIENRLIPDRLPATDAEITELEKQMERAIYAAGIADAITDGDLDQLTALNFHTVRRAAARTENEQRKRGKMT